MLPAPGFISSAKSDGVARASLGTLDLAVARGCLSNQSANQAGGDEGYIFNSLIKIHLIARARSDRAANLADKLQRGLVNFFVSGGRLKVVQRFDIAAHGADDSGRRTSQITALPDRPTGLATVQRKL